MEWTGLAEARGRVLRAVHVSSAAPRFAEEPVRHALRGASSRPVRAAPTAQRHTSRCCDGNRATLTRGARTSVPSLCSVMPTLVLPTPHRGATKVVLLREDAVEYVWREYLKARWLEPNLLAQWSIRTSPAAEFCNTRRGNCGDKVRLTFTRRFHQRWSTPSRLSMTPFDLADPVVAKEPSRRRSSRGLQEASTKSRLRAPGDRSMLPPPSAYGTIDRP